MEIRKKDCKSLSRTQVCIVNALLRLMQKDDISVLTIKEITAEAEIARSTFYLNYKSKDDVLKAYVQELFAQFKSSIPNTNTTDAFVLAKSYFEFWQTHLDVFLLFYRQGLLTLLLDQYEDWLLKLAVAYPAESTFGKSVDSEGEHQYLGAFCSAGLWNLLKHWVLSGAKESPEDMARMYQRWMTA